MQETDYKKPNPTKFSAKTLISLLWGPADDANVGRSPWQVLSCVVVCREDTPR